MKTLITTALLCLVAGYVSAQRNFKPGYIVNLQGDTIKGLINYKGESRNALLCTFKPATTAAFTDYSPTEIKAYGFENGKLYQSVTGTIVNSLITVHTKFTEEPVDEQPSVNFMNVLVRGKASLFTLTDVAGKQHFYLQKDAGAIQQLYHLKAVITDPATGLKQMYNSRQFTGVFISAFQDCPSLLPQIQKTEFKESEMQELVVAYNACTTSETEIRSVERPKPTTTWGVLTGVNYSHLNLNDGFLLVNGTYSAKPSITAGLYLNLTVPQLNEKLSLQNSLMFVRRKYTSDFNITGGTYGRYPFYNPGRQPDYSPYYFDNNYNVTFNLNYAEVASQLRYTVPKGTVRPFISAGLSLGQLIKHKQEMIFTNNMDQPEPREYPAKTDYLHIRKTEQGFLAALGLVYYLPSDKKLTLETRIHKTNGFIRYWEGYTKTRTVSILVGMDI